MNCPECKTTIKENVSLKKGFFKLIKVYTYFCPLCNFRKEVLIKISKENYSAEIIQLENITKTTKMIYDTTRNTQERILN